jgi:YD repeat-containing protein
MEKANSRYTTFGVQDGLQFLEPYNKNKSTNMIKKKIINSVNLLFLYFFFISASAQSGGQVAPKIIPNSPEAASLGKYAEIPVSYYTGIPEINIPIYDVKTGSLQVNIGLSYHASGVRVDEIPSWIGSGWTLNSGGVITRNVRGKPDDSEIFGGFLEFSKDKTLQYINNLPAEQQLTMYDAIAQGCSDAEPDLFFLNVNGITAKFSFKWNNEGLAIASDKNIKINCIKQTVPGLGWPKITGWDVIDGSGTIYKFRDKEQTFDNTPGSIACQAPESFTSSWYLTEITDVNGENKILFTYENYTLDYGFKSTQTRKYFLGLLGPAAGCLPPAANNGSIEESVSRTQIAGLRIKDIKTADGTVVVTFIPGADRTDNGMLTLPPAGTTQNFKTLDRIEIKNLFNNEIQTYKFDYNYSTGRLTLNTVTPLNNGVAKTPPHQFSYFGSLPFLSTYNYSQDHWGFYNAASNSTLIPPYWLTTTAGEVYVDGANRESNADQMKNGILTKIQYPTGGRSEFDFEANDYGFVQGQPVSYYKKINRNFNASVNGSNITSSTTITTNFVVNANPLNTIEKIPVTFSYAAFTQAVTLGLKPWVRLKDGAGNEIFFQRFNYDPGSPNPGSTTGSFIKKLSPGSYTLQAFCVALSGEFASIDATFMDYDLNTPLYEKTCGGLRIKEIREFSRDADPNFSTRSFKYDFEGNIAKSSGVIYQEPVYEYPIIYYCYGEVPGVSVPVLSSGQYLVQVAQNKTVLGQTQGSHIGYREVKVYNGKEGQQLNGASLMKFVSPVEAGDEIYFDLPFRPGSSQNYKTGLQLEKSDYKTGATKNQYFFKEINVSGLRVMKNLLSNYTLKPEFFLVGGYTNSLGFSQVSNDTTKTYSQSNPQESITITSQNEYDTDLKNLKRRTTDKGNGTKMVSDFYYPQDYLSPSATITKMKELNVVSVPVETITKLKNSSEFITAGSYQNFEYSNLKLRLKNVLSFNTTQPVPTNNFQYSVTSAGGSANPQYINEITNDIYDSRGNILQYTSKEGISTSFVWGYNQAYPVAKIIGATSADILTALNQTDQNLAYLQNLNETQLVTELNKLRNNLKVSKPLAQVFTYTYAPLIGMLTQTDPNGKTMTYEYDSFNRLKLIKDQDGHVIKKIDYQYQQATNQ